FKQTGELFRSYGKKDQADLIASLGGALAITDDESKYIMLSYFYKADSDYG
ncbi:catalase, partial [Escherichia coli]|nr:catalase [Escherichia coli]